MSEVAEQIFNEIKHGDEKHQAWLLETLDNSPTLAALQRRVEELEQINESLNVQNCHLMQPPHEARG